MNIVDFRAQKGSHSPSRIVCYSIRNNGNSFTVTGRAPQKDVIANDTILLGVPYVFYQDLAFQVEDIQYRPHRGEMSNLWYWTAKCVRHHGEIQQEEDGAGAQAEED